MESYTRASGARGQAREMEWEYSSGLMDRSTKACGAETKQMEREG